MSNTGNSTVSKNEWYLTTQGVKASTEDKQAVPIKGDKYHEAVSTACNGNTHRKNDESAGWYHKDFMKEVTFSLRHRVSQV